MDLSKIPAGKNPPHEINVVIEIPAGGAPVKYEFDKESGALFVDRFMTSAMFYPAHYGFVPNTLSDDGDPVDVLVIAKQAVVPGAVIRSRPIGVLLMEDENGQDEKILAVPVTKLHPAYESIRDYTDLEESFRNEIEHFFTHYKDLEKNKWVKIKNWDGAETAARLIEEGLKRIQAK